MSNFRLTGREEATTRVFQSNTEQHPMQRRQFIVAAAIGAASTVSPSSAFCLNDTAGKRIPLGLDGHSMRSMRWKKWKATQLIEFAAEQKLDAALFNGLHYFESLEASYLQGLKDLADRHEMKLYIGAGGIANNGKQFRDTWGTAEELLTTGIRVATTLGSPVVNVRIGSIEDRFLKAESSRELTKRFAF